MRIDDAVVSLVAIVLGGLGAKDYTVPTAAAPMVVAFAGPTLPQPVLLRGMDLNAAFLSQLRAGVVRTADTTDRPRLAIALYYARSMNFAPHPDSIVWEGADLRGEYFPPRAGAAGLVLFRRASLLTGGGGWQGGTVLTDSALAILKRHGVPVR